MDEIDREIEEIRKRAFWNDGDLSLHEVFWLIAQLKECREEKIKDRAKHLYPGEKEDTIEGMGWQFANAVTEEYSRKCWLALIKQIKQNEREKYEKERIKQNPIIQRWSNREAERELHDKEIEQRTKDVCFEVAIKWFFQEMKSRGFRLFSYERTEDETTLKQAIQEAKVEEVK